MVYDYFVILYNCLSQYNFFWLYTYSYKYTQIYIKNEVRNYKKIRRATALLIKLVNKKIIVIVLLPQILQNVSADLHQ